MTPNIKNKIRILPFAVLFLIGVALPKHAIAQYTYEKTQSSKTPYSGTTSEEKNSPNIQSPVTVENWDTEFKVSFRAGMSEGMNESRKFELPGALSKYRLGNEFDQYGEFLLRQDIAKLANGSILSLASGGEIKYPYGIHHYHKTEASPKLTESYLLLRNVPWLGGGALTAGRSVDIKDRSVHIYDLTYQDLSGLGVGIQDVPIGPVKATWTLTRKDDVDQSDSITRNNFLLEGFEVNHDGFLELGFTHIGKDKHHADSTHTGWSALLQHRQLFADEAKNLFIVQYGEGPGTDLGFTGDLTLDRNNTSVRLMDAYEWQKGRFGGQVLGLWQRDRLGSGSGQDIVSLGGRTTYGITDYLKLALEIGHDQIKPTDGVVRSMTKFTLAPTLSPSGSGFWKRPEIRLFYTYALWNAAAQTSANELSPGSALSETGVFGSARHGGNFGIQIEYWNNYTPAKTALKYMGW